MLREPRAYPCHECDCDADGYAEDGSAWRIKWLTDDNGSPLRFERCPRRLISPRSWFFVDLFRHYQNGVLPCAGGLLEQPCCYTRAMSILDRYLSGSRA